jgi:4-amino-4-deoxy-L-arabinose transferase-like glycosyltransferase
MQEEGARASRPLLLTLGLLLLASLVVRIVALKIWGIGAVDAGYVRLAENLVKGRGYVGIMGPGLDLNTPPFLPLLISGASFLTGGCEQGLRFASVLFGAFLPLPVFGIALQIFGRRTALIAAAFAILHPLLVNLSIAQLPEGIYATLLLSAVYLVLRALNRPSIAAWLWVGVGFGLAYLDRPEAFAPLLIAAFFALTATAGSLSIRCKRTAVALLAFAALALPEVMFIYKATGKVRLDAKSALVFALSSRVLAAQAHSSQDRRSLTELEDEPSSQPNIENWQPWQEKWASAAIDASLKPTGVFMRPAADVIRESHITLTELFRIVGAGMRRNTPMFLEQLSSKWFGAPFLTALAVLGAFRRPWPRPLASRRLFVLLVPLTSVVATFSALWTYPRFYFVLVPFLLIWAANGLVEIGLWVRASSAFVQWRWLNRRLFQYVVPGLIGLITVVYPVRAVRALYEFSQSSSIQIEKEVGLWIGQQQDRPVTIMDQILPLAFYAVAQLQPAPYCNSDAALRFLDAAKVDYVILRRGEVYTKYYEDWLAHGIPDPRAQLVFVSSSAPTDQIFVYRWHRADAQL